jgi:hypothetical protein
MELYIQIRDGQPFEHPIMGENFRSAFPHIDVDNLPPEFARFERINKPKPQVFEVIENAGYAWVDGVVKDIWVSRPMTAEEESSKRQDLTVGVSNQLSWYKERANNNISSATSEDVKQIWLNYLAQLDAWVLEDITNPLIPRPPVFDQNGNLFTTSSSGSAPNVIT